jgi:hypothetical protein
MGGAPPSLSPLTSEVAEFAYNSIIEAWGIHELSPSERLKSLETFTSFDLHQKVQSLPILPVLDDDLVPYNESFKIMASEDYKFKAKQCQGAMIVYSPLDVSEPLPTGSLRRSTDQRSPLGKYLRIHGIVRGKKVRRC